jgi:hypothetical protein
MDTRDAPVTRLDVVGTVRHGLSARGRTPRLFTFSRPNGPRAAKNGGAGIARADAHGLCTTGFAPRTPAHGA